MDIYRHTYLFDAALWTAEGVFFDESGNKIPVHGKSQITHDDNLWINESKLEFPDGIDRRFENRYEIVPFGKYSECTFWKSSNAFFGDFNGTFVIIDDTLFSHFVSEKDNFTGYECFFRVSRIVYKSRGCVFKGITKQFSWSLTLIKSI